MKEAVSDDARKDQCLRSRMYSSVIIIKCPDLYFVCFIIFYLYFVELCLRFASRGDDKTSMQNIDEIVRCRSTSEISKVLSFTVMPFDRVHLEDADSSSAHRLTILRTDSGLHISLNPYATR